MSQTKHGNADAIRRYATELGQFSKNTQEQLRVLHTKAESLGANDWKDQNFQIYKSQLDDAIKLIYRVLEEFDQEQKQRLLDVARQYDEVVY